MKASLAVRMRSRLSYRVEFQGDRIANPVAETAQRRARLLIVHELHHLRSWVELLHLESTPVTPMPSPEIRMARQMPLSKMKTNVRGETALGKASCIKQ